MNLEGGKCSVCYEKFSSGPNLPRILSCGHTLCHSCVQNILRNNKKCAICRKEITYHNVEEIPVNFLIKQVLDEVQNQCNNNFSTQNEFSVCRNHNRPKNCKCVTCDVIICRDCCMQSHKDCELNVLNVTPFHEKKKAFDDLIQKIEKNIIEKKKEQETNLELNNRKYKTLNDKLRKLKDELEATQSECTASKNQTKASSLELTATSQLLSKLRISKIQTLSSTSIDEFRKEKEKLEIMFPTLKNTHQRPSLRRELNRPTMQMRLASSAQLLTRQRFNDQTSSITHLSAPRPQPRSTLSVLSLPFHRQEQTTLQLQNRLPAELISINVQQWMTLIQGNFTCCYYPTSRALTAKLEQHDGGKYKILSFQDPFVYEGLLSIEFCDFLYSRGVCDSIPTEVFFKIYLTSNRYVGEVIIKVDGLTPRSLNFLCLSSGIMGLSYKRSNFYSTNDGCTEYIAGGFQYNSQDDTKYFPPIIDGIDDNHRNCNTRGSVWGGNSDLRNELSRFYISKNDEIQEMSNSFGKVVRGMEVVDQISQNCYIKECGFVV